MNGIAWLQLAAGFGGLESKLCPAHSQSKNETYD
jgi:hypothetical protein